MPIAFEYIQPNTLLPLFYAEITPSQEPISPNLKLLLVGYMNKDPAYREGTAVANDLKLLSRNLAAEYFGPGSMLDWMFRRARENAPTAEIWGIAVQESLDAVRSVGKITVLHDAAGPVYSKYTGVARIYIHGVPIECGIKKYETADVIAQRLAARINTSRVGVKATHVALSNEVILTCRWAGASGNMIRVTHVGPLGKPEAADVMTRMAKIYFDLDPMQGGVGEHAPTQVFDALGDTPFDVIAMPPLGEPGYVACEEWMGPEAGRWSPYKQLYGHIVTARIGDYQSLQTWADDHNDPHMTVLAIWKTVVPPWEWSSALAGVMVTHWAAPPELSRPLQSLKLLGCHVGDDDDESFNKEETQVLLSYGMSTFHVDRGHACRIDRIRTLRKYNVWLDPDPSWADAVTMFQAMYFVRAMRAAITGAFPRAALTTHDSGIPGFASPNLIRLVMIHEYKRLEDMGLVENHELFTQYLVVERNPVDRNRVDALLRIDVVNQLRVVATVVETHLELLQDDPLLQIGVAA